MSLIWAACGRRWGYRFLLDGGYQDPLPHYERAFANVPDDGATCRKIGNRVVLRLPDPLNRKDTAGRVIMHDFVVMGPDAASITSVDDGLEEIWPIVADAYSEVWDADKAPTAQEIAALIRTGSQAQPTLRKHRSTPKRGLSGEEQQLRD